MLPDSESRLLGSVGISEPWFGGLCCLWIIKKRYKYNKERCRIWHYVFHFYQDALDLNSLGLGGLDVCAALVLHGWV